MIENKIRGFRFPTLTERQLQEMSQRAGRELTTPQAAHEVDDVALRLNHLDALGIDIQVLHNTLWLERQISQLDEQIRGATEPFALELGLLQSISGVKSILKPVAPIKSTVTTSVAPDGRALEVP